MMASNYTLSIRRRYTDDCTTYTKYIVIVALVVLTLVLF